MDNWCHPLVTQQFTPNYKAPSKLFQQGRNSIFFRYQFLMLHLSNISHLTNGEMECLDWTDSFSACPSQVHHDHHVRRHLHEWRSRRRLASCSGLWPNLLNNEASFMAGKVLTPLAWDFWLYYTYSQNYTFWVLMNHVLFRPVSNSICCFLMMIILHHLTETYQSSPFSQPIKSRAHTSLLMMHVHSS